MYGTGVMVFFLALAIPLVFFSIYEPASCFDGKKNQGETAPDLGGPCILLDPAFVQPIAVQWTRSFAVRDGFYNAISYVENNNKEAGVTNVRYIFKLYDARNILIAERTGETPIYPGKVFPIFEGRIDTGNRVPVRATFDFLTDKVWEKMLDPSRGIVVFNETIENRDTTPRVDAEVKNTTLESYRNVVLIATVFDANGNAINASRTIISRIDPTESLPVAFTWPAAFSEKVTRVDIVPLVLP
tara:strand:- start:6239 stop:6967 length:729 start_codon:yes stop_codon:yes gene_type:complete